jgi:hypothetical protein
MEIDKLGRITFNSKDLINEIYKGNIDKLSQALVSFEDQDYRKYLEFIEENSLLDWPIPLPKNDVEISTKLVYAKRI